MKPHQFPQLESAIYILQYICSYGDFLVDKLSWCLVNPVKSAKLANSAKLAKDLG